MGLRTKISAIFVPLLVLAVLAVSATEANHAVGVMVESLGDSGTVLVNQPAGLSMTRMSWSS